MQIINNVFNKYNNGKIGISGLSNELLSLYIKKIYEENNRNIVILTSSLYESNKLYQLMYKNVSNTLLFPMDDFLTSEALAISPDLKASRLETINTIVSSDKKQIVVTHLMGFLRFLPTKDSWLNNILTISKGDVIKKEEMINHLYNIGYNMESIVSKTGEMGNRGYIVDIFPINENNPIRIEFWGDEVESIRYFDLDSQLSTNNLNKINIHPFDEFITENNNIEDKLQKNLPLYTKVSKISDYLDNPIIIYIDIDQINNTYTMLQKEIFEYKIEHDKDNKTSYIHNLENIGYDDEIYLLTFDNQILSKNLKYIDKYESKSINKYNNNNLLLNSDLNSYINLGKTVIICLNKDSQIKGLTSFLDRSYILTDPDNIITNKINIIKYNLSNGFAINDYIVIGDEDLFTKTDKKSVFKSKFKYGTKISDLNKLKIGDYVVHQTHGIGIYAGIKVVEKEGIKKDYLQIEYKGDDKLYIPVEKSDLIWKYSSNEGLIPVVHKLGGIEWQKTKTRIRNKLYDMASKLLKIAAERELQKGHAFSPDTELQLQFEKEFSFEPTRDQLIATEQIKKDMEKENPMDRLLCGDVGYGKTEVAFRAIFKAVQDCKQVALLCPTTILSHQHYQNAIERFQNFGVNIALLNRFTLPKEKEQIIEDVKSGKIDLLIGTHRLLSNDIKFKGLGLLVIDEEQRFGVVHKEKIKEYKANVDVLTLSATPIPRTLQLSMLGIRNLSLIETPPMNRFPIQTYVLEYNDYLIKDAIYKELSRGGQVFILFNKVQEIEEKLLEIKSLVPSAKITYVHGQMTKQNIENRMFSFINGEFDILLCTTIIETGIDIPNVNTLIIIDADRFGLSQLYQIRGRVGRTNKIAYAYLMYKKDKVLKEIALKRLSTIKEFTSLGSGFSIALRDLSIRGAGDILGSEQAGFIENIGIELYLKMLNEEIAKLKGLNIETEEIDEKPLLNVNTHISNDYVSQDDLKMEIHRKINSINNIDKLNEVKKEIIDRFGKISEDMLIYMHEELFEKMAKEKQIINVRQTNKEIELILSKNKTKELNINELFIKANDISSNFKIKYQYGSIIIVLDITKENNNWIYNLIELVREV